MTKKHYKNEKQIGIIISYITTFASLMIGVIYTPILLRMLGQAEYGVYQIVGSIVGYLSLFSLGLDSAYVCFFAKFEKEGNSTKIAKLNGMFLVIFIFLGMLSLITGTVLTLNHKNIIGSKLTIEQLNTARNLMWLMVINSFITFPITVFNGIIVAHERFVFQKTMQLLTTVVVPVLALILLHFNRHSCFIVIASICFNIILLILYVLFCKQNLKVSFIMRGFDYKLLRTLLTFSSFIFINMLIDQINWNVDKYLLGRIKGVAEVAVYGVASQVHLVYMQMSTAISSVFVPSINQIITRHPDSNDEITDLFIRIGRMQFGILSLVVSGFCIFGKFFIQLWAGKEYDAAYYVVLILMLASLIPLIQNIGIEILRAKNKHHFRTIIYLFIAVNNVAVSIPLSMNLGAVGAAIGTAVSLVTGNGIVINIYYHKIGINICRFWIEIVKMCRGLIVPIIIGIGISRFISFDDWKKYILYIILYTICYAVFMWKAGMNNSERKLVKTFLVRNDR